MAMCHDSRVFGTRWFPLLSTLAFPKFSKLSIIYTCRFQSVGPKISLKRKRSTCSKKSFHVFLSEAGSHISDIFRCRTWIKVFNYILTNLVFPTSSHLYKWIGFRDWERWPGNTLLPLVSRFYRHYLGVYCGTFLSCILWTSRTSTNPDDQSYSTSSPFCTDFCPDPAWVNKLTTMPRTSFQEMVTPLGKNITGILTLMKISLAGRMVIQSRPILQCRTNYWAENIKVTDRNEIFRHKEYSFCKTYSQKLFPMVQQNSVDSGTLNCHIKLFLDKC